ncbi:hypothetical protein EDD11_003361 [Mortierella claussenii]|nr:hypothetical protein EDD11_003361 [Mortierella claussenii]
MGFGNTVVSWYHCISMVYPQLLICAALGSVLPLLIVAGVRALGFRAGGILAGTIAAVLMALHGGFVPAGGLVAIMQAIGALGYGAGFRLAALISSCLLGLIIAVNMVIGKDSVCNV